MLIEESQIIKGEQNYKNYIEGNSDPFYTDLFGAIKKADNDNLQILAKAYPGLVYAYEQHNQTGRTSFKNIDDELDSNSDYQRTIEELNRDNRLTDEEKIKYSYQVRRIYAGLIAEEYEKNYNPENIVTMLRV